MSIGGITPMADENSQRYSLPGVHTISSAASSPAEMTEDRRLPPLPRIEPLPRDPFNQFPHRRFAQSPPSSHDSFHSKSPWLPAEHFVAPPSPSNSTDSWLDSVRSHAVVQWIQPLTTAEKLFNLIAPNPDSFTRKKPLQQTCGRKRKESEISGDMDAQREKHRVAEGTRRKNLSQYHRDLDERLADPWLELVGWNRQKSLPESKEHIVQASIKMVDFMRSLIIQLVILLIGQGNNDLPRHLQEIIQDGFRCAKLEQRVSVLQQEIQISQQENTSLRQDKQRLEERIQALEYQLRTGHMLLSPKSEHSSPQQVTLLPNGKSKAMLPGLRGFYEDVSPSSPASSRLDAPSTGTSQSFGHTFLSQTPPTTGPSSPVFPQSSYFGNSS
ncbi:hypothetical protein BJY01DRAFT_86379 [Aspergillus pseudoustus]|uniref:BHLH domain-containing protein n=1 Tax=Aspergillus pseudoustus TaxID=1810923 RepID=A0ABR4KKJ7_9EURO